MSIEMIELIDMSPRWGCGKGNTVFLYTCRPAGAKGCGGVFSTNTLKIPKEINPIGLKKYRVGF